MDKSFIEKSRGALGVKVSRTSSPNFLEESGRLGSGKDIFVSQDSKQKQDNFFKPDFSPMTLSIKAESFPVDRSRAEIPSAGNTESAEYGAILAAIQTPSKCRMRA